jgi:hypothetical protein
MKTFTATATFPEESITAFALANGWTDKTNPEYTNGMTEEQIEALPTAEEFVSEYLKNQLIDIVGRVTVQQIQQKRQIETQDEINEYQLQLNQAISLSVE